MIGVRRRQLPVSRCLWGGATVRRGSGRDLVPLGAVVGLVAGAVLVVFASPALLTWLSERPYEWERLSAVGEAYGGVAPVFSSVALVAVAVSLLLQWRQSRVALLYSNRMQQLELAKLSLDNTEFLYVEGADVMNDPDVKYKVYANLMVAFWATAWDLRRVDSVNLRRGAARLFESEVAREWWPGSRLSYARTRRGKKFVDLLDEEYASAVSAGPGFRFDPPVPTDEPAVDQPRSYMRSGDRPGRVVFTAVGMVLGAAAVAGGLVARQYLARR
ncbi:DUF6082 family protein [Phytohabitans sp. LJ34]|uniref:DUF6082 family protein n=1 Tax=Phytohabitans sp. LJ34 TaxID=3452217 RepID=UPI003F8A95D2